MSFSRTKNCTFSKPTPTRLANAALFYLSRYAASEASLRRVLNNKIRRASMMDKDFADDKESKKNLFEEIEIIIAKHKKTGAINDKSYAEMKVASLRRSGKSARYITQSLRQKGVDSDLIERALVPEEDENPQDVERAAAVKLARRRRLGPFRKAGVGDDPKLRTKEFATLVRAGFSFDVAKKVLGAEPEEFFDEE